jgi:Tetratricopeptide repeat/Glycosyltransferase family 9 (heptosyltransferase)
MPSAAATETSERLNRGRDAIRAGQWREAAGICQDLLAASPEHAPALAMLGVALSRGGDIDGGIVQIERAVAIDGKVAGWHANLCALYRSAYRTAEAIRAGETAVGLNPKSAAHLVGLALALIDQDERVKAMACLLRAIGQDPKDAPAHLALGQMLLAQGEMGPGWREYEWRNETEVARRTTRPRITSAPWNGMRIAGRLLLIGDQGFGDTIQFARYASLAASRCQELVLACSAELAPLLSKLPGVASCHHRWKEIPPHAAHILMSSLPLLFNTELAAIPSAEPYLFADPARIAAWRDRLAGRPGPRSKPGPHSKPGLRVGLAWSGRPEHPNDRRRSLGLRALLPLAAVEGVSFVSLQKPLPKQDAEVLSRFSGLEDHSTALTDFGETAALMCNLDLVITIDTAMAHLAGALGRPTWVLLAKPSDWRWLLDRTDSPWYPSLRLFRQLTPGEWAAPITAVAEALRGASRYGARKPSTRSTEASSRGRLPGGRATASPITSS